MNQEKKKNLPNKMPWVIPSSCEGCGDCVNRCPLQGLVMYETNIAEVYVPWLLDPSLCSGCGKCAEGCIMGGIVMTEYVPEALQRFLTKKPQIASLG